MTAPALNRRLPLAIVLRGYPRRTLRVSHLAEPLILFLLEMTEDWIILEEFHLS